jgi:hypothetical protein
MTGSSRELVTDAARRTPVLDSPSCLLQFSFKLAMRSTTDYEIVQGLRRELGVRASVKPGRSS